MNRSGRPISRLSMSTKFDWISRFGARIDPPGGGQQVELDGEDVLQGQPQDEDRDADAEERDDGHRTVRPALGMPGGVAPERDADAGREDHGRHGQLDGRREPRRGTPSGRAG